MGRMIPSMKWNIKIIETTNRYICIYIYIQIYILILNSSYLTHSHGTILRTGAGVMCAPSLVASGPVAHSRNRTGRSTRTPVAVRQGVDHETSEIHGKSIEKMMDSWEMTGKTMEKLMDS